MSDKFHLSRRNKKSFVTQSLNSKKTLSSDNLDNFNVSFQFLDTSQKYGSGFKDWQKVGLLSKALDVLRGYCHLPLINQVDGNKFTIYGDFPPPDKTMFIKPTYIPEDANWARIHINGKAILVGHIVRNTFYIVFLDKSHCFFLTRRSTEN